MDYRNALRASDAQIEKIERNRRILLDFRDESRAEPMVLINTPVLRLYTTGEMMASPEKMLEQIYQGLQAHLDVGDDYLPQARVEFGTAQVAHAYGCKLYVPEDSPACAGSHVLDDIEEIDDLENPALDAGLFGRAYEFTQFFREHLPGFVGLEMPDLQSPFNNAHLVRGNDILLDFYDDPERLDLLLAKMTDYQIALAKKYREVAELPEGYFYDWGVAWRGHARLSDCSLHMISTDFYDRFIKKHDVRYLRAVGTGRIHYCGSHDDGLIDSLCAIPENHGLDLDSHYHDLWALSERVPREKILLMDVDVKRVLSGDLPKKRNIIVTASAPSAEEGQSLYRQLKQALCER